MAVRASVFFIGLKPCFLTRSILALSPLPLTIKVLDFSSSQCDLANDQAFLDQPHLPPGAGPKEMGSEGLGGPAAGHRFFGVAKMGNGKCFGVLKTRPLQRKTCFFVVLMCCFV